MNEPLRIGILGGGANSAVGSAHMAALRMDSKYTLGPCLFSHLEEENRNSHDCYGVSWPGKHNSLSEWLQSSYSELDLVAILTPSPLHKEHIFAIVDYGLSFVTEKPVGCSIEEAAEIRNLLSKNPTISAYFIHNYSGYPMFRELALRAQGGAVGKIHHIRVQMPSDGFARERVTGPPQAWRQADPEVPMIMLDLGTHMHHLVAMILGIQPSKVLSRMHKMTNSFNVFDNVEIWERRADNIEISYWMSKAHLGEKNGLRVEVYGADGSLVWMQTEPDILLESDINSNVSIINRGAASKEATRRDRFKAGHPTGYIDAFANFYADLAEDFLGQKGIGTTNPWIRPIEEALRGIDFLGAAARSHNTGNWEDA
jgi:predicted dehydrogenase